MRLPAHSIFLFLSTLLCQCLAEHIIFHPVQSWAITDEAPSTLILNDTPGEVSPTRARSLMARSASINSTFPSTFYVPSPPNRLAAALNPPVGQQVPFPPNAGQLFADWERQVEVAGPNTSDRGTLLNLARACWDAYHPMPGDKGWYDIHGVNWTSRFGWRPGEDGLRGHLFLSPDENNGLIVFKGTSLSQLGSSPNSHTSPRDRLNDNLLFSCCCANVPWRIETDHPCDCRAGKGRCCSSCLTESLLVENTYLYNADLVVRYFSHKYSDASFWLAGHSLGGSIASLIALRYNIPTVTFEAPGERLAALRLGLIPPPPAVSLGDPTQISTEPPFSYLNPIKHITHVFNNLDPVVHGECTGSLSLCAQAGYVMESKCHVGQTMEYNVKKPGWSLSLNAHRMQFVLDMLSNEELEVPVTTTQDDCEDCTSWEFGEFEDNNNKRSWWKRLLDHFVGRNSK